MDEALALARQGALQGEVPVGAVVVDEQGAILGQAHNRTLQDQDPSAHAEILALRLAALAAGNHRLGGCVMVVTLEPCLMCAGAIREARLAGLVQEKNDRLADPFEHLHFHSDIRGRFGKVRGVDQIKDDVGLLADIAHRLLAAPERTVGQPVPDLAEDPSDR